jgi:spoIIIJ-associated protein
VTDTATDPTPEAETDAVETSPVSDLEREADIAADYVEGLLDVLDIDGDIDMDVEGTRATVSVIPDPDDPGALDALVGTDGEVLDALQDLTRLAVTAQTGERSRLMLDVARFRANRRAELVEIALSTVEQVRRTQESVSLKPMTPFERKAVHDAVAEAGLTSASDGEEPNRFVVVHPQ